MPPRQAALLSASRVEQKGNIFVRWITSTDHKVIGYMYLIASVLFFMIGGVMALIIRAELFQPGMQVVPTMEQYNQLTRELFFGSGQVRRFRTLVAMGRDKVGLDVPTFLR